MSPLDVFTDQQRRHLAHIYAALTECIADEIAYDREPDFAPLDAETAEAMHVLVYDTIWTLMYAAHAQEAAAIEAEVQSAYAVTRMAIARAAQDDTVAQ